MGRIPRFRAAVGGGLGMGLAGLVFLAGCHRAEQSTGPVMPARTGGDIFTKPKVLRIEIEIPRSGLSALRHTHWGNGDERPIARATIKEDGVVYNNVAVHLKGAAGSFRPVDDRPSLTLNFDKFVPGQSFHGLHKISLNSSVQDPSYLSEKICRELFDAAGVPVPRAGHALVQLNGRELGLYVVLEGANKQFLKRYFKNCKGNLFDGGFLQDVSESLEINCGDDPNDRSGLTALRKALEERRHTNSLAPLEKALDVDRFISMVAMEVIQCHWDGYSANRNNWRVFQDLEANRMVFIPHGLDQTFGVGSGPAHEMRAATPPRLGKVTASVLGTAEGRKRYRQRLGWLCTNVFQAEEICARVDEIESAIQPALAEVDPAAARNQQHQATWFKQRIRRRSEALRRELSAPVHPLKFGSDNCVRVTGWKPSQSRSGNPALTAGKDAQGRAVLIVRASNRPGSGSWRTRAVLEQGQYRLEGNVQAKGVTVAQGDPRSGAGLRVSKGSLITPLAGTTEWTHMAYEFNVEDETMDLELICELRASGGEAWFDAESLRLVRLP